MAEVVCSRCGHPNSESSNYCSSCGFDLHRNDEEPTSEHQIVDVDEEIDEQPEAATELDNFESGITATFVVKRGAMAGSRYPVNSEFTTIGRHPDSDIFLDDVTVSRRHAQVHRDGEAILISDVGSLNGTYLNRARIETANLRSGDEVQVGKFKFVFLTDDA